MSKLSKELLACIQALVFILTIVIILMYYYKNKRLLFNLSFIFITLDVIVKLFSIIKYNIIYSKSISTGTNAYFALLTELFVFIFLLYSIKLKNNH